MASKEEIERDLENILVYTIQAQAIDSPYIGGCVYYSGDRIMLLDKQGDELGLFKVEVKLINE